MQREQVSLLRTNPSDKIREVNKMTYRGNTDDLQMLVKMLFGEQTELSYPLPDVVKGGLLVEHYFIYPSGTSIMAGRPFARITVEMETGLLLFYRDCRIEDFMNTEEHPLTEVISYELPEKVSVKTFKTKQSLIYKLYEDVKTFAFKNELTADEQETLRKYVVLVLTSEPEALVPFYKRLGINFFSWAYESI